MSNQQTNPIIPKLRFPEFRNAGDWVIRPFGELYAFKVTNSFSRDLLNYENGKVKNIHYGDIHTKYATLFDIDAEMVPYINPAVPLEKIKSECYCREGDMIFADASEDLDDIGKSIEIVHLGNQKVLSGLHTLLARQTSFTLVTGFGGYLFMSDGIRSEIRKEAQGAKVLGISATRLSTIDVYYPENKAEQQKIADCLASFDVLITTQIQKITTLKSYKKAMMQRLFPFDGEDEASLRFPEFKDHEHWSEFTLGQCLSGLPEYGINAPAVPYSDQLPTYLRITDITGDGHFSRHQMVSVNSDVTSENYLEEGDIVLARTGASVGKSYKYRPKDGKLVFAGFLIRVRPDKDKLNSELLFQLLSTDRYWRWVDLTSARSGQPGINAIEYASMPILLPPSLHEQKKIADFLSSLDEIIYEQTERLTAFKTHKRGLMQHLFPIINSIKNEQ